MRTQRLKLKKTQILTSNEVSRVTSGVFLRVQYQMRKLTSYPYMAVKLPKCIITSNKTDVKNNLIITRE